jgi:hypothetical protein
VRVHAHAPIVERFSTVVQDVRSADAATFEVNVLNRDSVFVRSTLVNQVVMAHLRAPARACRPAPSCPHPDPPQQVWE